MADYKKLIPAILKWEGGFVNDPLDAGGATNKGITITTYENWCLKKGCSKPTVEQLKNLGETEWTDIFKSMYWDRWRADEIKSQSAANILVDWVWCSGVHGIKYPQKLLGVEQDGCIGAKTLEAVNRRNSETLFEAVKAERIRFVEGIVSRNPSQAKFLKGWKNRINDFKFVI